MGFVYPIHDGLLKSLGIDASHETNQDQEKLIDGHTKDV
jgi:hypothetical protein